MLAGLTETVASDEECGQLAGERAYNFFNTDRAGAAIATLDEALGKIADPAVRAELEAMRAEFLVYSGHYQPAARLAAGLLARPGIRGTPLAIGHHITGLALLFESQPGQAVARLEQAIATPG